MAGQTKCDAQVFRSRMGPTLNQELESWKTNPELGKIVHRLNAFSRPDQFLDCFAEYAIARCFVNNGCELRVEVPNPLGRTADLKACKAGSSVYVHIKRLNRDECRERQAKLESLFIALERINRPLVVELCLRPDLDHNQAIIVARMAKRFIEQAEIGDQYALADDGMTFGTARVLCKNKSDRATIWIDYGVQEFTEPHRIPKKLSQAYKQFMPDRTNVVFIAWNWIDDYDLFEFENILFFDSRVGSIQQGGLCNPRLHRGEER